MAGTGNVFDRVQVLFNGANIFNDPARVNNVAISRDGKQTFINGFSANHVPTGILIGNKETYLSCDIILATETAPTLFEQYDYDSTNVSIVLIAARNQYNTQNVYNGGWSWTFANIGWARDTTTISEGTDARMNVTFAVLNDYTLGTTS